jgi:putative endonuclease
MHEGCVVSDAWGDRPVIPAAPAHPPIEPSSTHHASRITHYSHHVYMLRCADGTLYTGYTTDVTRRLAQHQAGAGARYTRGRRPVTLVAAWPFPDASAALREEARLKRLPRRAKERVLLMRDA